MAEQRFGAAVAGIDVALGVEHHDAFGRGVEDGGELLGIGVADRGWARRGGGVRPSRVRRARGWPRAGGREDQRQRRLVVPGNRIEVRLAGAAGVWPGEAWVARKSSPACRCPRCCWRWRRRARHRVRRDRRLLPAHEGSIAHPLRERPGWHRAAGRAGRSARRPGNRSSSAWSRPFRRAPAARDAPASRAVAGGFLDRRFGEFLCGLFDSLFGLLGRRLPRQLLPGFQRRRPDGSGSLEALLWRSSRFGQLPRQFVERVVFHRSLRPAISVSPMGRNGRTFLGVSFRFPRYDPPGFPNSLVESKSCCCQIGLV